jgi:hypothetical protein
MQRLFRRERERILRLTSASLLSAKHNFSCHHNRDSLYLSPQFLSLSSEKSHLPMAEQQFNPKPNPLLRSKSSEEMLEDFEDAKLREKYAAMRTLQDVCKLRKNDL